MSDAVRELEVEVTGFYVGARVALGDKPEKPDDVRPTRIIRRHTGEVIGSLDLTTRDACLLARQLSQGIEAPRAVAELVHTIQRERSQR